MPVGGGLAAVLFARVQDARARCRISRGVWLDLGDYTHRKLHATVHTSTSMQLLLCLNVLYII